VLHAALIGIALVWLAPSLGLFITSWRPPEEIAASGWWTTLGRPVFTAGNYDQVLTAQGFGRSFVNSLLITVPSTALPVTLAALAGYAFAWLRFRGRDAIFLVIIALLIIPLEATWVPVLRMFNNPIGYFGLGGVPVLARVDLRLTRSFAGIWLAHTAYGLPFAIFLLRNFFAGLPRELFESAKIDGASNFVIFRRIALPLSVPAIASLTIFQFMWVWNDLMNALIFLQDPAKRPLTVSIQALIGSYGAEWHLLAAGAFVTMSVPLVVFFALQRYFVRGITAGAIKG
jgi:alpha-glucoside transport system permease protein